PRARLPLLGAELRLGAQVRVDEVLLQRVQAGVELGEGGAVVRLGSPGACAQRRNAGLVLRELARRVRRDLLQLVEGGGNRRGGKKTRSQQRILHLPSFLASSLSAAARRASSVSSCSL